MVNTSNLFVHHAHKGFVSFTFTYFEKTIGMPKTIACRNEWTMYQLDSIFYLITAHSLDNKTTGGMVLMHTITNITIYMNFIKSKFSDLQHQINMGHGTVSL